LIIILSAVSIVILIKIVGIILVIAFLTIPQYLSEGKTNTLMGMILLSCVYTICFGISGLIFSFYFNTTSGASIIIIAGIWFVVEKMFLGIKNGKSEKIAT
jgi:zinc transport system permease protein